MKVGFVTSGCDGGRSGIGQYALQMAARFPAEQLDLVTDAAEAALWRGAAPDARAVCVPAAFGAPFASICWTQAGLPALSAMRGHDVLFLPAANRRVPFAAAAPTVGVVHDLAGFHVEGKYDPARMAYIRHVLPALVGRLTHVITVSEASKRDIVAFTRVPADRVTVIPLAADLAAFSPERRAGALPALARRLTLPRRYILYVSRIEHPAKNHVRLIAAFERLKDAGLPHALVLAGPDRERAHEVHRRAAASRYADAIHFTGFLDGADLPDLYRGADCVVIPSLFEGFGLPVLEAMASGVPVACSDGGSLPEVAGRAAIVFDPYDEGDMASAIHRLLTDPDARERCRAAGLHRVQQYSWDRTASATWRVIEGVAREQRQATGDMRSATDEFGA